MTHPDPGARRHSRSNGLDAPAFVPLVDIDPRVAEVLLGALFVAGIPAYVEPSPGARGGYLDVHLPNRPTDRLWVDQARRAAARTVVDEELRDVVDLLAEPVDGARTRLDPATEELAWLEIIAGYDRVSDEQRSPWPAQEDVTAAGKPTVSDPGRPADDPDRASLPGATPTSAPEPPGDDPPSTPRVIRRVEPAYNPMAPAADPLEDEHFVPPPPPPIPRPSGAALVALLAIGGGILVLLAPGLFGLRDGDGAFAVGILAIVGGAGGLIWRMRDAPGEDDADPDDGAVV